MTGPSGLVRRAQVLMTSGMLASFLGTQVVDGAVSGLIAAGLFPLLWVPLYRTLTEIEDGLAAAVAPLVARWRPGGVLVAAESLDLVASAALLVVILARPDWTIPGLVAYLVLISVVPLVIDLAEEFFLNDVGQVDESAVVRANTMISVGTVLVGTVLGKATGVLTSSRGIVVGIVANLVLSGLAIALRTWSRRTYEPDHEVEEAPRGAGLGPALVRHFFPRGAAALGEGGVLAPWVSGVLALVSSVPGLYVLLWIAGDDARAPWRLGLLFVLTGATAALVPLVAARVLRGPGSPLTFLRALAAGSALGLVLALLGVSAHAWLGWSRWWVAPGMIVAGASSTGLIFALRVLRQTRWARDHFTAIIGWVFSISALCGLAGTWLGYALGAARAPAAALGLAAALAVVVLAAVARGSLPRRQ